MYTQMVLCLVSTTRPSGHPPVQAHNNVMDLSIIEPQRKQMAWCHPVLSQEIKLSTIGLEPWPKPKPARPPL